MPPEFILVPLAVVAIAAVALRVRRARRRRDPGRHALPGEPRLAWLGDRIDDSIGMWALRRLLGRADDSGDAARTTTPAAPAYARDRMPRVPPPVDPRSRLWRDAAVVLLVFVVVGAIVASVRPSGPSGGVAALTATPEGSLTFVDGASVGPAHTPGPSPSAKSRPAKSAPGRTPGPQPAATARPASRPTPSPSRRPTRLPTTKPTATPTPTAAPPVAHIAITLLAPCSVDTPASYMFSGATSSNAASYAWTFGGGIAGSSAVTVTRDFPGSTAGTAYTITLIVESPAGASDTDSTGITVVCP